MTFRTPRSEAIIPFASLVCVNGFNYAAFLLFSRSLPQTEFLDYSSATAILMLAFSISEAGAIYAAPPFLKALRGPKAARISAALVAMSLCILACTILVGAVLWDVFDDRPLDIRWTARCILLVVPNVALQNWLILRFRRPLAILIAVSALRAVPLFAVQTLHRFDQLLVLSSTIVTGIFLFVAIHDSVLRAPRARDLATAAQLIRRFFVLRLSSTAVTSAAPFLIGTIAGANATAVYLLGDRVRALASTIFQPAIQGLYFGLCRAPGATARYLRLGGAVALMILLSLTVTISHAELINQLLYNSRHPDPETLALFIGAGHVSALTSLGYFLFLIPRGHGRAFVNMGLVEAAVFLVLLITLTPHGRIRYPGIAALSAELLLMALVAGGVAFYARMRPASAKAS